MVHEKSETDEAGQHFDKTTTPVGDVSSEKCNNSEIANKVVDALFHRLYEEIGKSILKKFVWVVVLVVIGTAFKLGIIKIPGFNVNGV